MGIFDFDIRTMIGVLFWGNATCLALVFTYVHTHAALYDRKLATSVMQAKGAFALAFFLIALRNAIPDILSVNAANSIMLLGSLAEARSILMIIHHDNGKTMKSLFWLAAAAVLALNASIFLLPDTRYYIAVGSYGIFALLIVPACKLLFSDKLSSFKRIVGFFYMVYIVLLLPRGVYFISNMPNEFFPHSFIQSFTYIALMLLTIFSLSAFLLLIKEESDEQLEKMAHTDFLTGLNNRQHFLASVAMPFERHRREQLACSIMFLDIDHFKQVNDTFGHAFGDRVLVAVAGVLRQIVRGYDIPCRFGGEEFAVFIDSASVDAGRSIAERIREQIEQMRFPDNAEFRMTISIGVATCVPGGSDTIDSFIQAADEALYEAKEAGRNRVVERMLCNC